MQPADIAVTLRRRTPWEATDLGLAMMQRWWRPVYAAYALVLGPVAALLVFAGWHAGAVWVAPAEDHPLEAWDKLVGLNLVGAFVMAQQAAKKAMIPAQRGRIINVASTAGLSASDPAVVRTVSYNATKHGVVGMTRQLAAEWGAHGITVNAICPGFFPSRMTQVMLDATGAIVLKGTPTGRLGGPDDLKGLAVLLASDASRHITGQAIAVDGGATLI